jgi:hypothetical protein
VLRCTFSKHLGVHLGPPNPLPLPMQEMKALVCHRRCWPPASFSLPSCLGASCLLDLSP